MRVRLPPKPVRRAIIAPAVVVIALAAVAVAPVLLLLAATVDLILRSSWRALGFTAFALWYLVIEAVGIIVLAVVWLAAGAGVRLRSPAVEELHYRFSHWWAERLVKVAMWLFNLEIVIEDRRPPEPGAVIVLSRHAGPGDSVLLAETLMTGYRRRPRIVMKAALQWDPCVDILSNRLRNAFIAPGPGARERQVAEIAALAHDLGDQDALIIFPEGGNFSPRRRMRAIAKLTAKGRSQHARHAVRLRHLIPPRPGGVMAAIAAAPHADVVFVAHTGLEEMARVGDLWRSLPLERPLRGRYWRLSPDEVPDDPAEQIDWLYEWWAEIDEWIAARRPMSGAAPGVFDDPGAEGD